MKKIALFLILTLGCFVASAQDLVTKKDGSDIKAKVIEVSPSEVKYKAWDNLDGPVFVLPASDVLIIRFENGSNYVMESVATSAPVSYFTHDTSILGQSGLKYNQLKDYYDADDFDALMHPRYGLGYPWLNLLFPGLAQYCMSEGGLGTRYLLIYVGGGILASIGGNLLTYNGYYYNGDIALGKFLVLAGAATYATAYVLSIVNAYDVAKVKSLYADDMKQFKKQYSISLTPTVLYASTPTGFQPTPGLGLRVTF